MGQSQSEVSATVEPVVSSSLSIFSVPANHTQNATVNASVEQKQKQKQKRQSTSTLATYDALVSDIVAAKSFVSPQDLRFCTASDVDETASLLLDERAVLLLASRTTADGLKMKTLSLLDDVSDHMMKYNKFQDVLREVHPEVLQAAVSALQSRRTTSCAGGGEVGLGVAGQKIASTDRVNDAVAGVESPCGAVRGVGRLLIDQQLYRSHVLCHIDEQLLSSLFVGSSGLGARSFV